MAALAFQVRLFLHLQVVRAPYGMTNLCRRSGIGSYLSSVGLSRRLLFAKAPRPYPSRKTRLLTIAFVRQGFQTQSVRSNSKVWGQGLSRPASVPLGLSHKVTPYKDLKEFVDQGRDVLSHPSFAAGIIHTAFKSLPLVQTTSATNSHALTGCEALFIESPDDEDLIEWGQENTEQWAAKSQALRRLLEALATKGRLRSFTWTWRPGYMDWGQPEVPSEVWFALHASGSSLESLNIDFTTAKSGQSHSSWDNFPSDRFSPLRHLRLGLDRAHGGDGTRLGQMLTRLAELRSLDLVLTNCCGLDDISLVSYHPHLRSFSLDSCVLPNKSAYATLTTDEFLKRHPTLEYISLRYHDRGREYSKGFDAHFKLDEGDLPNLRALAVNPETLRFTARALKKLLRRPLEALHVESAYGSRDKVMCTLNPSLKCLSLEINQFVDTVKARTHFCTRVLPEILQPLRELVELRVEFNTYHEDFDSQGKKAQSYSRAELVQFFESLPSGYLPSLTALTFKDYKIQPLNAELLNSLPCSKLPALRYLGWTDKDGKESLYELTRHEDGRVSAHEVEPLWIPPTRDGRKLWIDDNVLDHFGKATYEW